MSPEPMIVTFLIGDPAICEVDKSLLLAQHKNSRFLPEKLLLLAILSILLKKEMVETTYTQWLHEYHVVVGRHGNTKK